MSVGGLYSNSADPPILFCVGVATVGDFANGIDEFRATGLRDTRDNNDLGVSKFTKRVSDIGLGVEILLHELDFETSNFRLGGVDVRIFLDEQAGLE